MPLRKMKFLFQIHGNLKPTRIGWGGETASGRPPPPHPQLMHIYLMLYVSQLLGDFVIQPMEEKVLLLLYRLFAQKIK